MRTIWQSLAWKEWHEHKWRLAAITSILCGLLFIALVDHDNGRDVFGGVIAMTMMVVGPLAIFVGAGTAASERSRGTLAFLQSLPVPLWRVALHKLAFGLLTVVVPVICLMALLYGWSQSLEAMGIPYHPPLGNAASDTGRWHTPHWAIGWGAVFITISASLYVWTIAAGARRTDEISAGAFGLLAMVGWWIVLVALGSILSWVFVTSYLVKTTSPFEWIRTAGSATAPAGVLLSFDHHRPDNLYPLAAVPIALVVHTGLALWYVRRFNSAVNLEARSPVAVARAGKRHDWLRPPFASAWRAIAWKQFRESLPVAIAGLAGILAICTVLGVNIWIDLQERLYQEHTAALHAHYVLMFASVAVSIGMFIAAVAGIGVALHDTTRQVASFWRSRPVNPDLWYVAKFITGLFVLLATIYLPVLVLAALFHPDGIVGLYEREHLIFPVVQIALFTTSLALTSLLRQAVYAAVLSIGVVYLGVLPTMFIWSADPPPEAVAVSLLVTAGAMTIVGWLAMRCDWGWRR